MVLEWTITVYDIFIRERGQVIYTLTCEYTHNIQCILNKHQHCFYITSRSIKTRHLLTNLRTVPSIFLHHYLTPPHYTVPMDNVGTLQYSSAHGAREGNTELTHSVYSLSDLHVLLLVFDHRQTHGQLVHHLLQFALLCGGMNTFSR